MIALRSVSLPFSPADEALLGGFLVFCRKSVYHRGHGWAVKSLSLALRRFQSGGRQTERSLTTKDTKVHKGNLSRLRDGGH
jgi:hypothetical protein